MNTIRFHKNDLPDLSHYDVDAVAIDTETLGLNPHRDRLCVVQISPGDGSADVIQIAAGQKKAPNLVSLLKNRKVSKLFHFGRFDLAVLYNAFGVMPEPVFCTKIASRLVRTYTDRHGLKDICQELLWCQPVEAAAVFRLGGRRFRRSSSNMPRPTCFICTGYAMSWPADCSVTAGQRKPTPASASCRPVPNSISWAGTKRISSPTVERPPR